MKLLKSNFIDIQDTPGIRAPKETPKCLRWLPHRRHLPEDFEQVAPVSSHTNDVLLSDIVEKNEDKTVEISKEVNSIDKIDTSLENLVTFTDDENKQIKIKEFRDEANRPWWKFFDEFEYRETTEESSRYRWNTWFYDGTSKEEKKLLLKLDIILAFYSFIGYWVKYIDSANLNNAYVSGMKEDLGMQGNDLINTQVLFTVGQIVFELPWVFLLPRVSITHALFISELCWSAFTICSYRLETASALKAIRFFVGASEAAYFPCIHYLLSSWYLPTEIGRRGAIFYIGQFLGVLTSGLLQGAAYKNLSGINGLEGWRWMFIIDGCISFAVAILALVCIPGTPFQCYSLFLTDDEIRLGRERMIKNGSDPDIGSKALFNKKSWKKAFSTWHIYLLGIINMMGFNSNNTSSGSFILWLKSLDMYSVSKINNLSTVPPALGILYVLIICVGADITRKRFIFVIISFLMNFIGNTILAVWDVSFGAKWFGFSFGYWSWSQSSVFNPLISDMFRKDNDVKAIGWMAIYITGLQSSAWIARLIWPTVDSPRFLVGFSSCAGFSMGFSILLVLAYYLYKRDERREALENGIYVYNSKLGPIPDVVLEYQQNNEKSMKETDIKVQLN